MNNFWNNTASINLRSEVADETKGHRSGTPAVYEEHLVSCDFCASTSVKLLPDLSYTHGLSPYGLRALDIQPGLSVPALQNAAAGETPAQTMESIGAETQALTIAGDLIGHF